jgi:2-C-methyl-D-erythritol 4-phosphate cytidylyltransferase
MDNSNYYAIIVAGGNGTRMGADQPKQFLLLDEKPILMHTIQRFYENELCTDIILVMNPEFVSFWKSLCESYKFYIPHTITNGGVTRFESVKNGLSLVKNDGIVAIHDAVRPLVSNQQITLLFKCAEKNGNAIPATKSRDSIRKMNDESSQSVNREHYYQIQTPQCFRINIIQKAYNQEYKDIFTDDACVVEAYGEKIFLENGEYSNIKITYPEDLIFANAFLKKSKIS